MTTPDQHHNPAPGIAHLRALLDGIWAATTFDAVAEAAAGAVVSATRYAAARARLGREDADGQAVATVGAWEARTGKRWLPGAFRTRTGADGRHLRDKSGIVVGTLSTLPSTEQATTANDRAITGLLGAQAGLAAGYLRLQDRSRRLDKELAAARRESHIFQRAWQIAIQEAPHPIVIIALQPTSQGQIIQGNDAYSQLVGREAEGLVGTAFLDLVAADERPAIAAALRRAADGRRSPDTRQTVLTTATGQHRRVRITTTAVLDTDERPQFAICHLQHREESGAPRPQQTISPVDAAAIADQITRAVKSAQRYDTAAALLLCDLSNLDQPPRDADPCRRQQLISDLAARLGSAVRDSDLLSQVDDHTLSVLIADTHPADAHAIAVRVHAALRQVAHERGHQLVAPIGITMIDHNSDVHHTIRDATAAMHRAKSAATRISLHQTPPMQASAAIPATSIIRHRQRGGLRT